MEEFLDDFVSDLADQLAEKSKTAAQDDRGLFYAASRILKAYNELFAMTWRDVETAEERIHENVKH